MFNLSKDGKYNSNLVWINKIHTLRKLYFHFLSLWMGYVHGDSFPFNFEPNGIVFSSKSKGKLSPLSYPMRCERKCKYSFLSTKYFSVPTWVCWKMTAMKEGQWNSSSARLRQINSVYKNRHFLSRHYRSRKLTLFQRYFDKDAAQ